MTALALVVAAMLACAVTLSFLHPRSSEFGLAARADALTLRTGAKADLDPLPTTSLDLDMDGVIAIDGRRLDGEFSSVAFEARKTPFEIGSIRVPANWVMTFLSPSGSKQHLVLQPGSRDAAEIELVIPTGANVTATRFDGSVEFLGQFKQATLTISVRRADIEFALPDRTITVFDRLNLAGLSLQGNADPAAESSRRVLQGGSINSGSLWIDHVGKDTRQLNSLNRLSFADISDGVGALTFQAGLWEISARGRAAGIWDQPSDRRLSLKPDLLAVMQDNGSLRICIAILSFFAGLEITNFVRTRSR